MWHWVLLELWCLLYYVQSVICEPKDGIVVESGIMVSTVEQGQTVDTVVESWLEMRFGAEDIDVSCQLCMFGLITQTL